jgi:UDP-N-acetylmuramoylalanine--D-glutamate ligase
MSKVVVIGGGESGIGAAILAMKHGLDVFVSDFGLIADHYKRELINYNIPYEEGGHDLSRILNSDLVVKSPGVPDQAPILKSAKQSGITVISEIEFAYRYFSGTILAVTGSNGKTTTAGLLYHVLKTADKDVALAGNYGISFARILAESNPTYMVLEISSFQLDDIVTFAPHIAIILNITADHLDRYDYKMSNYVASKMRIMMNQTEKDHLIYNGDDTNITDAINKEKGGATKHIIRAADYEAGLHRNDKGEFFELSLSGKHNYFNACCTISACRLLGLSDAEIAPGLSSFKNLPHRLEWCGQIDGVTYINDSKATNVDAVFYALDAVDSPILWIAGGTDKGNDYSSLVPLVKDRVKMLICLGVDNQKLKTSFMDHIPLIVETQSIEEVVRVAQKYADKGDTVLLSPACASFDLFKNYMDRGEQFKAAVGALQFIT